MNWSLFDVAVRAARRIVRDEDVARDIAVEVCEAADADTSAGYIRVRARHRAIDTLRRAGLDMARGVDIERIAGGPTPEQLLIAKQTRAALVLEIGAEALFILERTSAFSDEEIGSVLNKSAQAVRQMRSRARRKLAP